MTEPAWQATEYEEEAWTRFDAKFRFRSRVRDGGSGIDAPAGSVTIDLDPIFLGAPSSFAAGQSAINALALLAMVEVFPPEQRLLVLDWQHPSYWFWPHRHAVQQDAAWPVEVFPNGDYYIFLNEDMTIGTFSHPWKQTLCIFGEPLVNALVPKLTSWLPIKHGCS